MGDVEGHILKYVLFYSLLSKHAHSTNSESVQRAEHRLTGTLNTLPIASSGGEVDN